jgi:hypothetical protein
MLRHVPSIPNFSRSFMMKDVEFCQKLFLHLLIHIVIFFLSSSVMC